ncbi:MAG: VF530 family protein [Polyangiaceae bacterium]
MATKPGPALLMQPKNPLHGLTLEKIVTDLVAFFGWPELGKQIDIRCFTHDPSITSSLKFLRKTPWAREKVESLYLFMLREQRRQAGKNDEG